jgi:biopolymer transport protein ExbD
MVRRNPFKRAQQELDLTPLIDVIFLILVFFLLTMNFTKDKDLFKVILPTAKNPARQKLSTKALRLAITNEGEFIIGAKEQKVVPIEELGKELSDKKYDKNQIVVISSDEKAPMRAYAYLTGVLNELGFKKTTFQVRRKK